jgi:hypothetical protein
MLSKKKKKRDLTPALFLPHSSPIGCCHPPRMADVAKNLPKTFHTREPWGIRWIDKTSFF